MTKRLDEEKDKAILEVWKEEASNIETPDQLAAFVTKLTTEYEHDYGTICHAMHAAMKAAMRVVDKSPQGGITGFQASCIGWMQVSDLFMIRKEDPVRLVNYADLLFPQYEEKFTSISAKTWEHLQAEAKKNLAEGGDAHPDVHAHWQSIAAGSVPFGLRVAAAV